MTAPAKARTTRHGGSAPARWLRLEGKTVEADGLTLEFEATAQVEGHGQRPDQLGELLAAGDRVRVSIRLGGPAEVTIEVVSSGGLGTPAAEEHITVPPEMPSPSPAEGEVNKLPAPAWVHEGVVPVYDLPALAAEVARPILPLSAASVGPEKEEEPPEERQVAITQELAPLEPGAGGEGGEPSPPEPPPVGEQGVMLAGAPPEEPRRRARAPTARPREFHLGSYQSGAPTDPARLAELRKQIAAGKYQPFAAVRRALK